MSGPTPEDRLLALVMEHPTLSAVLDCLRSLPEGAIGAGAVRDLVWARLHDRDTTRPWTDVDVVFYDPIHPSPERDAELAATLTERFPDERFDVVNQARPSLWSDSMPPQDLTEALRRWPETATAVAVGWNQAKLAVCAPYGLSDLFAGHLRPTPTIATSVFRTRSARFRLRWPRTRQQPRRAWSPPPPPEGPVLRGQEIADRLRAIGTFLGDHRSLWNTRPFTTTQCDWELEYPALAGWLRALDGDTILALDHASRPAWPAPLGEWDQQAQALCSLGPLPALAAPVAPSARGTHARKRHQLSDFSKRVRNTGAPLVDWCGGKGHLGRALAERDGVALTVVELQPALCGDAERLGKAAGLQVRAVCTDVQQGVPADLLAGTTVVALHACGCLTDALIQASLAGPPQQLLCAPCCCHRVSNPHAPHLPLSTVGRATDLGVRSMDLRLATAEEIAISGERRRKRARGMAYRLGLDLLLRQAGAPDFTPVAHTPPKLSAQGFRTFCETVAERDGLQLPTFQEAAAEAAGWERYGHVRALSLVRSRFRRSLELWCWLDRALALQEAGWEVAIGTFTHRSVTPRNVLIEARR